MKHLALFFTLLAFSAQAQDFDGDGYNDTSDKCPTIADPNQVDYDGDSVGDLCDNCPRYANARVSAGFIASNQWVTLTGGQRDDDHDGYGNRCDAKFPGTAGTNVQLGDGTEIQASLGESKLYDTCGQNNARACAEFDLDNTGTNIALGDTGIYNALLGYPRGGIPVSPTDPGARCPTCPMLCAAGTAGDCGSGNDGKWGPLSWYDPIFTAVTEHGNEAMEFNGAGVLSDASFTGRHDDNSSMINSDDLFTLTRARFNVESDAYQIYGGTVVITDSYIAATGSDNGDPDCGATPPNLCDHADGIQTFGTLDLTIQRTMIDMSAPHFNDGLFSADNTDLDSIVLDHAVFRGGIYAFRLNADGFTGMDVWANDVCFLGEFSGGVGNGIFRLNANDGGQITVHEWNNVNECEIVDGVLVPGDELTCESGAQGDVSCP